MANIIRIKRGLEADITKLELLPGELGVTLDTQKLYVGDTNGQVKMVKAGAAGSVESAEKLTTARNIAITGDATGNVDFDGSQNVEIALALATSGVTAGSYNKVTVNNKGLVTSAENVVYAIEDITGLKDALDAKANASDVYTKTETYTKDEVDAAIENAEVDAYTKEETNNLLAAKANSADLGSLAALNEVAETNLNSSLASKINNKANAATTLEGYGITDAYTSSKVDELLAAKAAKSTVDTLSGTVAGHTESITTINETLANKANSADVYTTTQVDGKLDLKANASETYKKSEVEGLLAGKVDTATLDSYYKKTETYSQTEVDNKLSAKADAATMTTELGKKADKTAVETLETNLTNAINEKATKATTIAGYGITDAYTKTEVDGMVAGTFHFRGSKDSFAQLPGDAKEGDVYQVGEKEYAWDGDSWVELGFNMDLSAYATTEAVANTYATQTALSEGLAAKANSADVYAKSQVYTKEEAEAAFMTEAEVTAKGYATTSAMNSALANKADKATTLAGYGITDAYTQTKIDELVGAKADKATTLEGYGITDAYTKTDVDGKVTTINNSLKTKLDASSVIDGGTFSTLSE